MNPLASRLSYTLHPALSTPARGRRAARDAIYGERWKALAGAREIAWQIIKYRMDHGLTQKELAARVGTSREQIARIESGQHLPSVTTLQRVADALGCRLAITFEPVAEAKTSVLLTDGNGQDEVRADPP